MELLLEHLGRGFFFIIIISMPIVLTAAGIGLIVGILQAVTQVQEQTIAAAPKILGVFLVLLIGGMVIMRVLHNYLEDAIHLATETIPKTGIFAAAPLGSKDEQAERREFFHGKKFERITEHPKFKEMLDTPLDSPYLKEKQPQKPDIYTPPPPIPDANIAEEVENYKDMMKEDKKTRSKPTIEQKAPVIPPLSSPKTNPTISILPHLDEPPAINPSDLKTLPQIASSNNEYSDSITGAAAYLTPDGLHKFDYNVKNSTIIISNDNHHNITSNQKRYSYSQNNIQKASIILEPK